MLRRLFYGKIRQRILLGTVDQPFFNHNKEDLFSHLPVSVSDDGTDLYDGLSRYMNNVVEYQGRKARMKVSVVELPSILQIQLQVGYHRVSSRNCQTYEPLPRERNSIARPNGRINLRLTLNFGRPSTWTDF